MQGMHTVLEILSMNWETDDWDAMLDINGKKGLLYVSKAIIPKNRLPKIQGILSILGSTAGKEGYQKENVILRS